MATDRDEIPDPQKVDVGLFILDLIQERDDLREKLEAAEAALADGSFYKESDIDALQDRAAKAEAALALTTARAEAVAHHDGHKWNPVFEDDDRAIEFLDEVFRRSEGIPVLDVQYVEQTSWLGDRLRRFFKGGSNGR